MDIWELSLTSLCHKNLVEAFKEHVLIGVRKFDMKKRASNHRIIALTKVHQSHFKGSLEDLNPDFMHRDPL